MPHQPVLITRSMSIPSPRIAILLGTFQGEQFLARQLDSIQAQTYTHWALWASDDRSTDNTLSLLRTYQRKWGEDRLVISSGPHEGFRANFLSLACNSSIQADYFAYC